MEPWEASAYTGSPQPRHGGARPAWALRGLQADGVTCLWVDRTSLARYRQKVCCHKGGVVVLHTHINIIYNNNKPVSRPIQIRVIISQERRYTTHNLKESKFTCYSSISCVSFGILLPNGPPACGKPALGKPNQTRRTLSMLASDDTVVCPHSGSV